MAKTGMSKLFTEIFDGRRTRVFRQLNKFKNGRYLVGGTALALQLGYRKSEDFDVFANVQISLSDREEAIKVFGKNIRFTVDNPKQLNFLTAEGVKVTFAYTPYRPLHKLVETESLPLLTVADIASDKAFTIGRRAAYRDYVDLYFILNTGRPLETIIGETIERYGPMFDEKLFLEQLEYLDDLLNREIKFIAKPVTFEEIGEFFHRQVRSYLKKRKSAI